MCLANAQALLAILEMPGQPLAPGLGASRGAHGTVLPRARGSHIAK